MNPEIEPNQAIIKIDEYLAVIANLLRKNYREGESGKEEIDTKITGFIRATFKDDDKKLKDYNSAVHFYVGIVGIERSEKEEQDDYISRLTTMKNHLLAFKEELNLILQSKSKSQRLDKIEQQTQEVEAEAKRRMAVVDEKRWGAVIELIQMQRDELKKKSLLSQEILNIKKDIADIKNMIFDISKGLGKDN